MVAGKEILCTGNHQSQVDAGRRNLQCCVESRWQVGGKWRRRRCCEGVFEVKWGPRQTGIDGTVGDVYFLYPICHLSAKSVSRMTLHVAYHGQGGAQHASASSYTNWACATWHFEQMSIY